MNNAVDKIYLRLSFISKDGYEVDVYSNYWRLNKDQAFYFDSFPPWLSDGVKSSFRQVLAFYAETCSANYTVSLQRRIRLYFESTSDLEIFSPESIISFRSSLADKQWELSSVRAFFRTWIHLGHPGIPLETLTMMEKWRIKGNEKGLAVQSMCPESGPLTDIEMDGVVSGVLESYAAGRIGVRDTCYAMILAMTGRRPIQITSLKIKDLIAVSEKYFINFPRGKQRHGRWRGQFNKVQIVEDLWALLQVQVESVKEQFSRASSELIPVDLVSELPLFAVFKKFNSVEDLRAKLSGDFMHARVLEVTERMRFIKGVIGVISERTGATTHLNPYRFRYTLGTNLAREGKGEYVIAEALDHSDIQNTGVYVRNIPEIVERIDKAVALQLAPIAQAFQGVLVVNEGEARRGRDPNSRICSDAGNVGSCGSYGFCSALAPVACYTCVHFQPWLDGPHEFLLDQLISERNRVCENTGDLKIASVNDRLILAVSDVVARCNTLRGELSNV